MGTTTTIKTWIIRMANKLEMTKIMSIIWMSWKIHRRTLNIFKWNWAKLRMIEDFRTNRIIRPKILIIIASNMKSITNLCRIRIRIRILKEKVKEEKDKETETTSIMLIHPNINQKSMPNRETHKEFLNIIPNLLKILITKKIKEKYPSILTQSIKDKNMTLVIPTLLM